MTLTRFHALSGKLLTACLLTSAARANVIDFSALIGFGGDPYYGHSEHGFKVEPYLAKWYEGHALGNPGPSIWFGLPRQILYQGRLTVTRVDLGLFTFKGIDTWSDRERLDIEVQGYRNGTRLFWDGNPNGLGQRWTTSNCGYPTRQVDTLVIDILAPNNADAMAVDNIIVDPVPEPAGFVAMSLATAAFCLRRRRTRRDTFTTRGALR